MIGKIMKNNSFRATTRYVLEKEEARLLDGGTIIEGTPDDVAHEFRMSRDLNPEIERPVYHLVQSYSYADRDDHNLEEDKLSDLAVRHFAGLVVLAQEPELLKPMRSQQESERVQGRDAFRSRVEVFLEEGLFEYQFFVAKHEDTAHTHTHLVASRINLLDGHCIPTYKDHYRSQVVCRELEQEFGLEQVPSTGEVERRSPSRRQRQKEQETGVAPVLTKLQATISEVALQHGGTSFDQFVQALEAQGVEVRTQERLVAQKRTVCISYAMDGVAIAGSKLGKRFTVAGLKEGFGVGKGAEEGVCPEANVPEPLQPELVLRDDPQLDQLNNLGAEEGRSGLETEQPQAQGALPRRSRPPVPDLFTELRLRRGDEPERAREPRSAAGMEEFEALLEDQELELETTSVDPTQEPRVIAGVVVQQPAPQTDQWIAAQLILEFVRQRLDATGRNEMESRDGRYSIHRHPDGGGIVVIDLERNEPITVGRVDNGQWQIIHADVGGDDVENFISYKQARQQKQPSKQESQQEIEID